MSQFGNLNGIFGSLGALRGPLGGWMGDASSQESDRVGGRRETLGLMVSWKLFSSLPTIRIFGYFGGIFDHFKALRSTPGVTDR